MSSQHLFLFRSRKHLCSLLSDAPLRTNFMSPTEKKLTALLSLAITWLFRTHLHWNNIELPCGFLTPLTNAGYTPPTWWCFIYSATRDYWLLMTLLKLLLYLIDNNHKCKCYSEHTRKFIFWPWKIYSSEFYRVNGKQHIFQSHFLLTF